MTVRWQSQNPTAGRPAPAEWQNEAGVRAYLVGGLRYEPAVIVDAVYPAVLAGEIGVRIGLTVCPADRLRQVMFDLESGNLIGWIPSHWPIPLPMNFGDEEQGVHGQASTSLEAAPHVPSGNPCEFNMIDLVDYFDRLKKLEAPREPIVVPNRGGRPNHWNWEGAFTDFVAHVYICGLPASPSGIADFLTEWFANSDAKGGPDNRDIRRKAQKCWDKCHASEPRKQ